MKDGETIENPERRAARELVQKAVDSISEHWENVQVFVNRSADDGDGTQTMHLGTGNQYARIQQVREWAITQDEFIREGARKKA